MFLMVEINVALREPLCQKIGSKLVVKELKLLVNNKKDCQGHTLTDLHVIPRER